LLSYQVNNLFQLFLKSKHWKTIKLLSEVIQIGKIL